MRGPHHEPYQMRNDQPYEADHAGDRDRAADHDRGCEDETTPDARDVHAERDGFGFTQEQRVELA